MKYIITAILCIVCCISCELRDPEREFEKLSLTAFGEPQDGMKEADNYLRHFKKNRKAKSHIQEVRTIYDEYQKMKVFAQRDYTDCVSLIADGREIDSELSNSKSSGVRTAWSTLYKNKRHRTQQKIMENLSEKDFSRNLLNQSRYLCNKSYLRFGVERVEEVSIGPVELIEDGTAKRCYAEYSVTLTNFVTNLFGSSCDANVSICGKYAFDSNGDLLFTLVDFNIVSGPKPERDVAEELVRIIIRIIPFMGDYGII